MLGVNILAAARRAREIEADRMGSDTPGRARAARRRRRGRDPLHRRRGADLGATRRRRRPRTGTAAPQPGHRQSRRMVACCGSRTPCNPTPRSAPTTSINRRPWFSRGCAPGSARLATTISCWWSMPPAQIVYSQPGQHLSDAELIGGRHRARPFHRRIHARPRGADARRRHAPARRGAVDAPRRRCRDGVPAQHPVTG